MSWPARSSSSAWHSPASAWLAWDRPRVSIALALWGLVPVAFFTFVPAGATFFAPRYLLPSLPFFLLLAGGRVPGARVVRARGGRRGRASLREAWWPGSSSTTPGGSTELHDLRLVGAGAPRRRSASPSSSSAPRAGRRSSSGRRASWTSTSSSTGPTPCRRPRATPRRWRRSSPAMPSLRQASGSSAARRDATGRRAAARGASREPRSSAVSPSVLLVRSAEPLEPRPLVELAAAVREAWLEEVPDDREAERLLRRDRYALGAS